MTLEEIERILRGVADGRTPDEHGRRVLRAAVSLLPAVRAAIEVNDAADRQSEWTAVNKLCLAIVQLRREMEE